MMSFRMVSLIASRLGKLSVMPTVSTRNCSRHVSRDASKAWMGQSQTHRTSAHRHRGKEERFEEEDPDMDDVDDKVQAVLSEERRRQRRVKYHIVRRQLTESGAPERRLSWDAMEQVRYLKQELPEEWTVDRLAEGFSVHRDVILRVLRSKFIPTPERKAKQDASVWARLRQQALPGGGGPGGQGRQQALPGGGAGEQGRQQALPGGGAGEQGRQQALPGGGAGGQGRQQALPGGGAGEQGRQQALPGGGAGGQGRQQALPGGGGSGGQGRQVALPGGGGSGGPGRSQLPGSGHSSSKLAMLPIGSGTGALVTLASHSSQSLIARDLEDGPDPRAMMTTANSPAAPLSSVPTQLSTSPTLHIRRTSGQENSREEWEEEDNVLEKVEEKEERWDGRVFSEEELEELMLSTKPSPVVQNGKEFFDSVGNFLYRI